MTWRGIVARFLARWPAQLPCDMCQSTNGKKVHTGEWGTFAICDACWSRHGPGACFTWLKQQRRRRIAAAAAGR